MPIIPLPDLELDYFLIAFDALGAERSEDDGTRLSEQVTARLAAEPITDVFLMSHGWRGDVPAARQQYDRWIRAMAACEHDRRRIRAVRPGFRPLLIGLHWPSEPWGNESLASDGSFAVAGLGAAASWIDGYLERLAIGPAERDEARAALETIFDAYQDDALPASLPAPVIAAYETLNRAAELGSGGPAASPADDREPFDAEAIYRSAQTGEIAYGLPGLGSAFLEPLRALSFWRMKQLACQVGESGGHRLLIDLQRAVPTDRRTRFHLMGHSFGCIVVSATVAGTGDADALERPVESLVLVQGAISLWSYCTQIPAAPERDGYFHRIISQKRVAGPIVTTRSIHDTAVGTYYPKAARGRAQLPFGPGAQDQISYEPGAAPPPHPTYGAVGSFGLQGSGLQIEDRPLAATTDPYLFEPGKIYNLECSAIISTREGLSGAHSDIAHPEVAHAIWEAAWASEPRLVFNGINAETGTYLVPPVSPAEAVRFAQEEVPDKEHLADQRHRRQSAERAFGVPAWVDRRKIESTGWGVIFAHDTDPAIYEALTVLLDHRRAQAGNLYREYRGYQGYLPDQTKNEFLVANGFGPGTVDPTKMPYYLLIVGDPESIPFSFQYQLDVQFAVGRIHFDTVEEYARYAAAVVAAETKGLALPRRAAFFGVQNPADDATSLAANYLVQPLHGWVKQMKSSDWAVDLVLKHEATKSRLASLLGGDETPALLFTATHGAGFKAEHALQRRHQGALICQDWPGPYAQAQDAPVSPEYYFAADDVGDAAQVHGLLAFHFACYGAGTPRYDDFTHRSVGATTRPEIAPRAFVGALPQRLLSHPKGGALAVIGHVERAWGCSFTWGGQASKQLTTFQSTLYQLMDGLPVGAALEDFNERYSELSTDLTTVLEQRKYGKIVDELALSSLWTSNNDARGYAIIGDPAVRLCAAAPGATVTDRAAITITVPTSTPPTNATASPATPGIPVGPREAPFGIGTSAPEAGSHLSGTLQRLSDRLAQVLDRVVEATTVTVATYQSSDMTGAKGGVGEGDVVQAVTRIGPGGDLDVFVPSDASQRDPSVWQLHVEMVRQAQAQRAELLKLVLETVGALLGRPPIS